MKKLFIVFFVFAVLVFVAYRWFNKAAFYSTVSSSNISQDFEIKEGDGIESIGQNLQSAGLVKNKYFFYYYVWKTGAKGKIQAGLYELAPNMTIGQMVEKFSKGEIKVTTLKLTIPEGFTNKKIIERLKVTKPELADEFEKIVSCQCINQPECSCDKFNSRYQFLQELPKGVDMEGYLFPDTYFIEKEDTGASLVSKMLNNFEKKVDSDMLSQIEAQGKSLNEVITMASIIEKEVKTDDDRKVVSGIFWNRLADGHALQSCATLAYILGVDKKQYSIEDTQIASPYNTYLNPGLPPGPVSNPGLASIKAAVYPKQTDYYFFLNDPSTGEIIYSKTGEEHAENKVKHGL